MSPSTSLVWRHIFDTTCSFRSNRFLVSNLRNVSQTYNVFVDLAANTFASVVWSYRVYRAYRPYRT